MHCYTSLPEVLSDFRPLRVSCVRWSSLQHVWQRQHPFHGPLHLPPDPHHQSAAEWRLWVRCSRSKRGPKAKEHPVQVAGPLLDKVCGNSLRGQAVPLFEGQQAHGRRGAGQDGEVRGDHRGEADLHSARQMWPRLRVLRWRPERARVHRSDHLRRKGGRWERSAQRKIVRSLTWIKEPSCKLSISFKSHFRPRIFSKLFISLPSSFEGLCADCNSVESDDYVTRTRVDLRNDKERDAKIGNSWRVQNLAAEEKEDRWAGNSNCFCPGCLFKDRNWTMTEMKSKLKLVNLFFTFKNTTKWCRSCR